MSDEKNAELERAIEAARARIARSRDAFAERAPGALEEGDVLYLLPPSGHPATEIDWLVLRVGEAEVQLVPLDDLAALGRGDRRFESPAFGRFTVRGRHVLRFPRRTLPRFRYVGSLPGPELEELRGLLGGPDDEGAIDEDDVDLREQRARIEALSEALSRPRAPIALPRRALLVAAVIMVGAWTPLALRLLNPEEDLREKGEAPSFHARLFVAADGGLRAVAPGEQLRSPARVAIEIEAQAAGWIALWIAEPGAAPVRVGSARVEPGEVRWASADGLVPGGAELPTLVLEGAGRAHAVVVRGRREERSPPDRLASGRVGEREIWAVEIDLVP